MKRIFIGIKIETDRNFRKLLSDIKNELKVESVKWTDLSNLHITLAFLGATPEDKIELAERMLGERSSETGSFEIVLRGLGVFKNLSDPKVLWAGIDQSEKLTGLQSSIVSGMKEAGISYDEKPFSPHLTLGRIKHIADSDNLKVLILKHHSTEIQRVTVSEVTLFESVLSQEGPKYNALAVHKV